jgi:hypothetical protein
MMRSNLAIAVAASLLIGSAAYAAPKKPSKGSVKVSINLYGEKGYTEVDSDGITYYNLDGKQIGHEGKKYVKSLWDQYKLYFFGGDVGVKVGVVNKSKKDWTYTLDFEAWDLNLDGTNRKPLTSPQNHSITVPAGKTVVKDISFKATQAHGAGTGLDRGTVTLSYGGKVLRRTSVLFCPPELYLHLLRLYDFFNFLP